MNLGAAGATWGISSRTFLVLYLALAVGFFVIALAARHRLLAGPDRTPLSRVTAAEAAYLNGGDQLALYAALAALRQTGTVEVGTAPRRQLMVTGDRPREMDGLTAAVYRAAGAQRTLADLKYEAGVSLELNRLRTGLEQAGLLPTDDIRRTVRTWTGILVAVLLLGVLRLFAGLANGRPVLFLLIVLVALGVAIAVLARRPVRMRAADRTLGRLRNRHMHLAPVHNPAWSTYGAAGAAMGVAVFGSEALWVADPEFAAQAGIQHRLGIATTGSSGGGSGGDSGSSYYSGSAGAGYGSGGDGGGGCGGGGGGGCGG